LYFQEGISDIFGGNKTRLMFLLE